MIRLPKRGDEEDGDEGDETDADDADDAEPVQPVQPEELEVPREAPIGGGKPFRKIQGQVYFIEGDEFITESDPKGDGKIDEWGNLLGGRRFKASTFILPNRHGQRKYMLAIDAARTSGFRDSLYYFRRNMLALKLNATQSEKDYLISEGKLGSHLRTRSVTLITARSAYKLHGSKTIVDGKWVTDDYYENKALEEIKERGLQPGDPVGDLPDPNAQSQANEAALAANRNDRTAATSGGPMYRAGGPTTLFGASGWGPFSDGPLNAVRKSLLSRDGVTEENWMWKMATKALESNEEWAKRRRENIRPGGGLDPENPIGMEQEEEEPDAKRQKVSSALPIGIYEPHTGHIYYRSDTQPTKSRLEAKPGERILGGAKVGHGGWGLAWVDTVMEITTDEAEAQDRQQLLDQVVNDSVIEIG
ncbi:chromatin remodelling complex Rsc7/Swp82 subunit-domain-containing protein [Mycena floridula]|nr:chromatin remodelling complex Rsc7/Swp82 subunit-domain-containing protein [Mycena floridula]